MVASDWRGTGSERAEAHKGTVGEQYERGSERGQREKKLSRVQ